MIRLLITGANGLLGQKLVRLYQERSDIQIIATSIGPNRNETGSYVYEEMDITSPESIMAVFSKHQPDVVIHTAAMTQVDACEKAPEKCRSINVEGVAHLIDACQQTKPFFIHLSTDFVFDGEDGPYREEDAPNPLSTYANSKLDSEKLVEASGLPHAIVRTMLVYGVVNDMSRSNIVLWVKDSLERQQNIRVVNDQWRMPTLAEDLAKACSLIADKRREGLFHVCGNDMKTPYEMALDTATVFNLDHTLIEEVDASVFSQPAKRPPKTGFILDKAKKELGYEPVTFKEGLIILKSQLAHA